MIRSLKLVNYKSLGAIELTGLTPFTLLGGTNNVGKTSILTSIYIYTAKLQSAMQNLFLARSDLAGEWADSYFHGFKLSSEKTIEIALDIDGTSCRLTIEYVGAIQPQEIFERSNSSQAPPNFLEFPNHDHAATPDPMKIAAQFGLPAGQQTVRALRMRWFEGYDCKTDIYSLLPPANSTQLIKYSFPGKPLSSAIIFSFMRGITPLLAQSLSRLVETGGVSEIIKDINRLFPI